MTPAKILLLVVCTVSAHATHQKIQDAARDREEKVMAQIERLRPTALTHPEDGEQYQALIAERARLHQML